ncbi:FAM72 protein-domain-containing protein [Syncephalis fuscata]|nr:FAM72 protein-domain-containing protein [Syncephalis fuscata]
MVHRRQPLRTRRLVLELRCRYCNILLTQRGDQVVLSSLPARRCYVSDTVPTGASVYNVRMIYRRCGCIAQDIACNQCGNIVGWVTIVRCRRCEQRTGITATRRWMYSPDSVVSCPRLNAEGNDYLAWNQLAPAINEQNNQPFYSNSNNTNNNNNNNDNDLYDTSSPYPYQQVYR